MPSCYHSLFVIAWLFKLSAAVASTVATSPIITGDTILNIAHRDFTNVRAYEQSTVNVLPGGNVSFLNVLQRSVVEIRGGAPKLLTMSTRAIANILGYDLNHTNGSLTDPWESDTPLEIRLRLDNGPLLPSTVPEALPEYVVLHDLSIPEPSTWILTLTLIASLTTSSFIAICCSDEFPQLTKKILSTFGYP